MPQIDDAITVTSSHAKFACDHCRQKKLRCSKDLPKCRTCSPWPGPCTYSHSASKRRKTSDLRISSSSQVVTAVHPLSPDTTVIGEQSGLEGTPNSITLGASGSGLVNPGRVGVSLITTNDPPAGADSDGGNNFKVPSRATGYAMMGQFLEIANMSKPFMLVPSEDIIHETIFEPHNIAQYEPGWVVTINYLLLSAGQEQGRPCVPMKALRQNTRLALNNSSIFLRPSEINIQALAYLAIHGEDYAAPNASWLMLSHACRQAEALSLHKPLPETREASQRRLCQFWLLFIVDKSCALAFGRPAFLPASVYKSTPLPDDETMNLFQPHGSSMFAEDGNDSGSFTIGSHFLRNGIEFAKLVGAIQEETLRERPQSAKSIRQRLHAWAERTIQPMESVIAIESAQLSSKQYRELTLGLNTLKFQYLHVLVVLLKDQPGEADFRLTCARDALLLLPSLVSNHTSVYNGVVWHLLYYPFAPFFVVFEQFLSSNGTSSSSNSNTASNLKLDLVLLGSVTQYFAEMRLQMSILLGDVCSRLQHITSTFFNLAQAHYDSRQSTSAIIPNRPREASALSRRTTHHIPDLAELSTQVQSPQESNHLQPDVLAYFDLRDLPPSPPPTDSAHEACWQPGLLERPEQPYLDSNFDWFAWDSYYASGAPEI